MQSCQVDFYALGQKKLEQILPVIAERILEDGGRMLVVSNDDGQLTHIDEALWTARPGSFLPHARSGTDSDTAQPILLSTTGQAMNGARNIALIDGVWRDEALNFARVFHLFDDHMIDAARTAWRHLSKQAGIQCRYWAQDDAGRWLQKA